MCVCVCVCVVIFESPLIPDDDAVNVKLVKSVTSVSRSSSQTSDMYVLTADTYHRFNLQPQAQSHSIQEPCPRLLKQSQADSQPDTAVAPHWGNMHRFTSGAKNITSASPIPRVMLDK